MNSQQQKHNEKKKSEIKRQKLWQLIVKNLQHYILQENRQVLDK